MINEVAVKSEFEHIRDAIIGLRVVGVSEDQDALILEDGSRLLLWESMSDCCALAEGEWSLNATNLDTNVVIDSSYSGPDDYNESVASATITILHEDQRIAVANCSANDGNSGYYLSALTLTAFLPNGKHDFEVVTCPNT